MPHHLMETIVFLDRKTLPVALPRPKVLHLWKEYDCTAPDETVERLREATIAITNKVKLRDSELSQAPKLKFIAVAATGFDVVDVAWCHAHGILVSNVPAYTGASVPEHVFSLLLALRRNLIPYHQAISKGAWQKAPQFSMFDYPVTNLQGTTLGLIGYGQLAREVEKRAVAFGMKVLVAERKGAPVSRAGRVAFEDVLRQSDAISLHVPLKPETRNLIDTRELGLMKKGAILINTARGGIVDETALADALRSGHLGGAGVDVLSAEPPRDGNPLLDPSIPNLIITPHIAWTSRQALAVLAEEIILNIEAFVNGKPRNLVS
jgi:glycerate dehydrogenase